MSRGLGKVQQDILATLEQNERALSATELAYVLFNEGRDDRDCTWPPRAYAESVRRAIHTLASRGLVGAYAVYPMLHVEEGQRLVCWLPNKHTAPRERKPIRGDHTEQMILIALDYAAAHPEVIDEYLRDAYYVPKAEKASARFVPAGAAPYSWLTRNVQPRIDPYNRPDFHARNASVAINRAVKRLVEQGRIRAKRGTRYTWIYKA